MPLMSTGTYIIILVTAKDVEEGRKIMRALLEKKLIACANMTQGVESMFWWEGKLDSASEVLLVMKSRKVLFNQIIKAIKAVHSYSVPEILALPILFGEKNYLNWLKLETAQILIPKKEKGSK